MRSAGTGPQPPTGVRHVLLGLLGELVQISEFPHFLGDAHMDLAMVLEKGPAAGTRPRTRCGLPWRSTRQRHRAVRAARGGDTRTTHRTLKGPNTSCLSNI